MTKLPQLIKNNLVLAVGILLPVVLVIVFFLAMVLPNRLVEPPRYDFLFTIDDYQQRGAGNIRVNFDVHDGKLRGTLIVDDKQQGYQSLPRLFRYEAARRTAREIHFELPASTDEVPADRRLVMDETAGLTLDTRLTAPDGYEFRPQQYYGGGLFTELFVGHRHRNQPVLSRQGANHRINLPTPYGYYNTRFIGWVIPPAR